MGGGGRRRRSVVCPSNTQEHSLTNATVCLSVEFARFRGVSGDGQTDDHSYSRERTEDFDSLSWSIEIVDAGRCRRTSILAADFGHGQLDFLLERGVIGRW